MTFYVQGLLPFYSTNYWVVHKPIICNGINLTVKVVAKCGMCHELAADGERCNAKGCTVTAVAWMQMSRSLGSPRTPEIPNIAAVMLDFFFIAYQPMVSVIVDMCYA